MSTFSGVREGDACESGITEIYASKPEYSNEEADDGESNTKQMHDIYIS